MPSMKGSMKIVTRYIYLLHKKIPLDTRVKLVYIKAS